MWGIWGIMWDIAIPGFKIKFLLKLNDHCFLPKKLIYIRSGLLCSFRDELLPIYFS